MDRMSLSIKNQWFDDKNRAYIYFSIEDIMELLNCGRNKAIKSMRELDDETGIGLIEKRRQGFGKVNVIYVKTFMPEKTDEKKFEEELKKFKKQTSLENEEPTEVYNSNFMKSQNQTSRSPESKLQEVYISNPNNTNLTSCTLFALNICGEKVCIILAFYKTYKPAIYILPVHSSGSGFSINSPFSEAVRWMEFLTA